jgi:hypothetical protein
MNKNSVKKKRPAKASVKASVKSSATTSRGTAARKAPARSAAAARKPAATRRSALELDVHSAVRIAVPAAATITVAQVAAIAPSLKTHKYRVGQTVFYTSSPISRPGASGSYKVVRLLPSDGEDYQYRIKNAGEAFERVAKESQLEIES